MHTALFLLVQLFSEDVLLEGLRGHGDLKTAAELCIHLVDLGGGLGHHLLFAAGGVVAASLVSTLRFML